MNENIIEFAEATDAVLRVYFKQDNIDQTTFDGRWARLERADRAVANITETSIKTLREAIAANATITETEELSIWALATSGALDQVKGAYELDGLFIRAAAR